MTHVVYIASAEGQTGKAAVALGLVHSLTQKNKSVEVFRPIVKDITADPITEVLISSPGIQQSFADSVGVSYDEAHNNSEEAMAEIIQQYAKLDGKADLVVAVGSDWTDVSTSTELFANAQAAANLNAPVILVVSAYGRIPAEVRFAAEAAKSVFVEEHVPVLAVIANRAKAEDVADIVKALDGLAPFVDAIAENRLVSAPTVREQFAAAGAEVLAGSPERLDDESLCTLMGGMTVEHALDHLEPEATVIAASDRSDLINALLDTDATTSLAGLILVGGYELPADLKARITSGSVPVATTGADSFSTACKISRLFGSLRPEAERKIDAARASFAENIDVDALAKVIDENPAQVRTPLAFVHQLTEMAKVSLKTIVLPESADDRILESAHIVGERGTANIILLGEKNVIDARAKELGLDVSKAQIISPNDPELVEKFAAEYARLRAKKGVTIEQARETLKDLSYFGTMLVHFGMADGMVSGAINTTANTIKPSFEFIKTKPGTSVVSSSFLMCLRDHVVVFGDCAVNPNPTPEQLADIALGCAETAKRFGIEPRVAMMSYSTGTSGKGEDVDAVAEATRIAKERAPELKLDGPIQFDAAVDMAIGSKKMPGSQVAGQATVFIFPDLNTGNNTYKAVQRSAGALAIGPVLQGLNKPVNDLSRGALVEDIVNTIAITAIQAQDDAK